ncbi:MAG: translation initiation factor IF-2, partial [Candidatus Lokiarchaeota archaeon]|nr:translation initiation factor IF-2 [Candidatus Lokiarchaeota archaeon]
TEEGKRVKRIHQIQDKGQTVEKAMRGSEVAISIRGIEIGRDIGNDETLHVNVPESHVRQLMGKFIDELTTDQKEALREFIKLKRTHDHPWWGF